MKAIELAQSIIRNTDNFNKDIKIKCKVYNEHTKQCEDLYLYIESVYSDDNNYVLKLEEFPFGKVGK